MEGGVTKTKRRRKAGKEATAQSLFQPEGKIDSFPTSTSPSPRK